MTMCAREDRQLDYYQSIVRINVEYQGSKNVTVCWVFPLQCPFNRVAFVSLPHQRL